MNNKPILLIDGLNLCYRMLYQPNYVNLKTIENKPSGVFFGTLYSITKLVKKFGPSKIIFCFDGRNSTTSRTAILPTYKAGRTKPKKAFISQTRDVKKCLKSLGIITITKKNLEADDLLWSLANQISEKNKNGIIVTADRDLLQCCNDNIKVYDARASKMWTTKTVKAVFDVYPYQFAIYRALVGDSSDNIKGVRGIGPKTAVALIQQYKTEAKLRKHLTPKQHAAFDRALSVVKLGINPTIELLANKALSKTVKADTTRTKEMLQRYSCHSFLNQFESWCQLFTRL